MCGIVGLVNTDDSIQVGRKNWFENALFVDQLRGKDSTGIYLRPKKPFPSSKEYPMAHYYKRALTASDFLRLGTVKELLNDSDNARVVIGHNRLATQGNKHDDDGAHPFTFGSITMVHNGTLITRRGLSKHHTVDSESIAYELSQTKPSEYTDLLKELDGAFALVWDNRTEEKVYIVRNDQRPLWLAHAYDNKTLLYSSEPWMIDQLMHRNKIIDKLDKGTKKQPAMYPVPENELFSVDYSGATLKLKSEKFTPTPTKSCGYNHNSYATGNNKVVNWKDKVNKGVNLTKSNCPFKKGDILYASHWEYEAPEKNKSRGTLRGVCSAYPNVSFVCGNVSVDKDAELGEQWTDWVETYLEGDLDSEVEILLSGEVTSISNAQKSKDSYVVNLKASTLKVEGFDIENYDDDLVVVKDQEDDKEKKNLPVKVDSGQRYKIGGNYVSIKEFLSATDDGCSICGADILLVDHDSIVWASSIGNGMEEFLEPVCHSCHEAYENPKQ